MANGASGAITRRDVTITGRDGAVALRAGPITHIIDGDKDGGGHVAGTGRRGKTEFPESWDEVKIVAAIRQVLVSPDRMIDVASPQVRLGLVDGVVVAVKIATSQAGIRVTTAFPMSGAGVVRNTASGPVEVPLDLRVLRLSG